MFQDYIANEMNVYYDNIKNSQIKNILKYSMEGGKCIRGFIVKHLIQNLSNHKNIWQPVVAVELIHGISLIIDDLPCMDNDIIRRNKPSTFVKFGERESILVSMYGISEAFKLLFDAIKQNNTIYSNNIVDKYYNIINEWNEEIGNKLIIGQMLDLSIDIKNFLDIDIPNETTNIMLYKTASLFSFCFILGAIYSMIDNIDDFRKMGYNFGLMFQLMDDYKDINTDKPESNYFLKYGVNNGRELYYKCKLQLLELLDKYNLYTDEFKMLIIKLDIIIENKN